MKKMFYVEYLEDSPPGGFIREAPGVRFVDTFHKGPATFEGCGFRLKRNRDRYVEDMNRVAGREIVKAI